MNQSSSHASTNNHSGCKVDGEESCYDSPEWDGFWDCFCGGGDDGSIDRSNVSYLRGGADDGNISLSNVSTQVDGGDDGSISRSNVHDEAGSTVTIYI